MKKLNELVSAVEEKIPNESYIGLVFKLLEIFIKDFGFDVIEDYFPQITNKSHGVNIHTCWWKEHSQIDSETFNYENINIESDGDSWKFDAHIELGRLLGVPYGRDTCKIYKSQENDIDLNKAFKREWQELFQNEKNDFVNMIVLRLNQGVLSTLLKSKPYLTDVKGFKSINEFMETEYAYVPSKEVLTEAEEILEKLRA
jgi:hypothetical protein